MMKKRGLRRMSQETNSDLYPEPIIANTKSSKAGLRLVILGVLLVGVSVLYFIYRDQLGQQFLLGLLGTLAMTGVFYLFGSAINVIQFTPRGTSDELTRAFVDTFPEGTVVCDQKGRIVYANRAYAELTGVTNSNDVRAIEHILSEEAAASDPIYRLANAVRDGVSGQEELRLSRPLDPSREPVPTWYRVKARPVAGIPGPDGAGLCLADRRHLGRAGRAGALLPRPAEGDRPSRPCAGRLLLRRPGRPRHLYQRHAGRMAGHRPGELHAGRHDASRRSSPATAWR